METIRVISDLHDALCSAIEDDDMRGGLTDILHSLAVTKTKIQKATVLKNGGPQLIIGSGEGVVAVHFPNGPFQPELTYGIPIAPTCWVGTTLYYEHLSLIQVSTQRLWSLPENLQSFPNFDPNFDNEEIRMRLQGHLGETLREMFQGQDALLQGKSHHGPSPEVEFFLTTGDGEKHLAYPKISATNLSPEILADFIQSNF